MSKRGFKSMVFIFVTLFIMGIAAMGCALLNVLPLGVNIMIIISGITVPRAIFMVAYLIKIQRLTGKDDNLRDALRMLFSCYGISIVATTVANVCGICAAASGTDLPGHVIAIGYFVDIALHVILYRFCLEIADCIANNKTKSNGK